MSVFNQAKQAVETQMNIAGKTVKTQFEQDGQNVNIQVNVDEDLKTDLIYNLKKARIALAKKDVKQTKAYINLALELLS